MLVSVLISIMPNKKCFSLTPKLMLISFSCFWDESETIPWVSSPHSGFTSILISRFFWSFTLPLIYRRENFFLVKNELNYLRTRVCAFIILLGWGLVSVSFISLIPLLLYLQCLNILRLAVFIKTTLKKLYIVQRHQNICVWMHWFSKRKILGRS